VTSIALLDDLKAQGVAFQSLTEAIDTENAHGPRHVANGRHSRGA
jgi:DNA invertase Pin-like site-specific DNA recombinase